MCSTDMCLEGLIGFINMTVHSLDNGLFQDLYLLTLEYNDNHNTRMFSVISVGSQCMCFGTVLLCRTHNQI